MYDQEAWVGGAPGCSLAMLFFLTNLDKKVHVKGSIFRIVQSRQL